MKSRFGWFARDDKGATAIEFAMIAGPLLLLVLGSMEFGRMIWTRQALYESAIAGARCMGVRQTQCASSGVLDAARAKAFVVSTASKLGVTVPLANVTANSPVACGGASGFSQVSLTYTFNTVAPRFLAQLVGTSLAVSACFPNSA